MIILQVLLVKLNIFIFYRENLDDSRKKKSRFPLYTRVHLRRNTNIRMYNIYLYIRHIYTFSLVRTPTTVGVPRRARAYSENNTPGFSTVPTINKHNAVWTDNYCGKNFSIKLRARNRSRKSEGEGGCEEKSVVGGQWHFK